MVCVERTHRNDSSSFTASKFMQERDLFFEQHFWLRPFC
ncbi:hypothetical protein CA54_27250 [Symmachiella macrocystis]|uniref:Uncharacterized protein n=1 Tax=Symmachiella macrocystis TaxID=2527985 RepID=A0A5C6BT65_9PLAN|nr:hypothetical protein CA54_27250 [Symmachiella macrocystis]